MTFSEEQLQRYSRHILLEQVGPDGQEKLLNSRALIIGAGGLGSPVALYLAAAGVGTIGIADGDIVDRTNLQRQIIHSTPDIDAAKVDSAKNSITALNPDVHVNTYNTLLEANNIVDIIEEYDFVIDGTDNFPAKFLINDACVLSGKAFSHGGILRFDGQTITHTPGHACYRCIFKEPPPLNMVPSCSQAGVLGAIAGMLGTIQAAEALKYLIGIGDLLTDRLLIFDALKMRFRNVSVKKDPACPVCGDNPTITQPKDIQQTVCDLQKRGKDEE